MGSPVQLNQRRPHHAIAAALVLAAIADSLSYLLLPSGAEANPLWVAQPTWAVAAKAAVVLFLLVAPLGPLRGYVYALGALLWTVGAVSNLLAL